MENLSGAELVKSIRASEPDMSIEDVLDKTRRILFERKMKSIKLSNYTNVYHVLQALINSGMTREEIEKGLKSYSEFLRSGHLDDAIEFINTLEGEPQGCFLWKAVAGGKRRDTARQRP